MIAGALVLPGRVELTDQRDEFVPIRHRMNRFLSSDFKGLLLVYRFPLVVLLLMTIPGLNYIFFYSPHASGAPLVGFALLYLLPFCTPYVLFKLIKKVSRATGSDRRLFAAVSLFSLLVYFIVLYPFCDLTAASLNYWGKSRDSYWRGHVFYKMITFPIGFVLPPYGLANKDALHTMTNMIKGGRLDVPLDQTERP